MRRVGAVTFRLFLSHSTPEADRPALTAIARAIEAESGDEVRVLYDEEQIVPGDRLSPRIWHLLQACDAAAVIVSEPALSSAYVLTEVTYLSMRSQAEKGFRFVPVILLPDGRHDRRLTDPPWDQLTGRHIVGGGSAEHIAASVVKGLRADGALSTRLNLMGRLAAELANILRKAPRELLHHLAERLGHDDFYQPVDLKSRAALGLARFVIQQPSLVEARKLLDELGKRFVRDHGAEVLELLAPLPIPIEAAAKLRRRDADGPGHSWLQSRTPAFTAPLYLDRAFLTYGHYRPLFVGPGLGTAAAVRSALREQFRIDRRQAWLTDPEVDRVLEHTRDLYVCIPPIDSQLLDDLRAAYPGTAFIVHHDEAETRPPPRGTLPVTPVLSPEQEDELWVDQYTANQDLRQKGLART